VQDRRSGVVITEVAQPLRPANLATAHTRIIPSCRFYQPETPGLECHNPKYTRGVFLTLENYLLRLTFFVDPQAF
jgi:hypothetical protein